jgi:hypothetical protein
MVHCDSFKVIEKVESFTAPLEQIPLEKFRTDSVARATFLQALDSAHNDFVDLVDEINWCEYDLKEIRELGLDKSYIHPNEKFLAAAIPLRDRFAVCFHTIKDLVLDGTHEEIDEFAMKYAQDYVEYIEEALRKY